MKVSIIIPVYNVEKYLKECLESAFNQTLKDIEIICINDGSTDKSLDILIEYQNKYSNLKIVNQENKGPGISRNVGVELAEGEYIYFLDSDDLIDLNAMEICYNEAVNNDLDIITFDAECFSSEIDETEDIESPFYHRFNLKYLGIVDGKEFYLKSKRMKNYVISSCLNLYKTKFIKENNIVFKDILHEDTIHILECFFKCKRIKYIDHKFYKRRIRPKSIMTSGINDKKLFGYIEILKYMIDSYNNDTYDFGIKFYLLKEIKSYLYCLMANNNKCSNDYNNMLYNLELDKIVSSININHDFGIDCCIDNPYLYSYDKYYLNKNYELKINTNKKIHYMLIPQHGDIDQQAVVYSTIKFLEDNYPDYTIVAYSYKETYRYIEEIRSSIKEEDFIIINGSTLGNGYIDVENYIFDVIKYFEGFPIVIFPYDFCSFNKENLVEFKDQLNKNNKLIVFARENKSYDLIKKTNNKNIFLCPDMVFYLYDKVKCRRNYIRNQVMVCLKNDNKNSFTSDYDEQLLDNISKKYKVFNCELDIKESINNLNREENIYNFLDEYYNSKIVITDELYAMIFAYITKTPCIVLGEKYSELLNNYEWIKNSNYIKYIKNNKINDILDLIKELEDIEPNHNNNFIYEKFNNLRDVIDTKIINVYKRT